MFTSQSLRIGDLTEKQLATISENLLSITVSYTMDVGSQITATITDPGLEFAANNYFDIAREVAYETTAINILHTADVNGRAEFRRQIHLYEIGRASVSQNGNTPVWTLEMRPKAMQQMKRDKKPGSVTGSGQSYVVNAAAKYGLAAVVEKTKKSGHNSGNSGSGQQDSVWDRLQSLAQANQMQCFISDGTLYFGTQKWLMYRWGCDALPQKVLIDPKTKKPKLDPKTKLPMHEDKKYYVPLIYPKPANEYRFECLSLPQVSHSDQDFAQADGSVIVARDNGVAIRPGMTVKIGNIPSMSGYYLVTSVEFAEQVTDPVTISFRTPERLKRANGKEPIIPQLPIGVKRESEYPNIIGPAFSTTVARPELNAIPVVSFIDTTAMPFGPSSTSPLPTARRPITYPKNFKIKKADKQTYFTRDNIAEVGNIDLWNRPLYTYVYTNGTKQVQTLFPAIYPLGAEYDDAHLVLCTVWCNSGVPSLITAEEAFTKYQSDALHLGIVDTLEDAKLWCALMLQQQTEIIKLRFPRKWKDILSGKIKEIPGC
jgi:hypothetical protein